MSVGWDAFYRCRQVPRLTLESGLGTLTSGDVDKSYVHCELCPEAGNGKRGRVKCCGGTSKLIVHLKTWQTTSLWKKSRSPNKVSAVIYLSRLHRKPFRGDFSICTVPNRVPFRVPGSPRGSFCGFGSPLGLLFCPKVPFFSILG